MGQVRAVSCLAFLLSTVLALSATAQDAEHTTDGSAIESTEEASLDVETEPEAQHLSDKEVAARAAFRRGDAEYLEGDYQSAVDAFQEAYALSGKVEMLFNLANAYERMGKYIEASLALKSYIPHAAESTRPQLERRVRRLDARAREREEQRRQPAAPTEPAPVEQAPFPTARIAGVGMITLGVAGILTGAAFGISALETRAKIKEQCEDGRRVCSSETEALIKRDHVHSLVADIALIGGGVLTAAGIYLVVKKEHGRELRVGTMGLGASVGARF